MSASQKLDIEQIWWRNVQLGEFYNIERYPQIQGGGGSLYIEIPSSMVPETLEFLEVENANPDAIPVVTIVAGVVGTPGVTGEIEFQRKAGGRMRIARQNRRQASSQRHPAWTAQRGFPSAPDDVANREEARPYFPDGGLRIYIARTFEGDYFAGFTKGRRPSGMDRNDPMWDLYAQTGVGGVIDA